MLLACLAVCNLPPEVSGSALSLNFRGTTCNFNSPCPSANCTCRNILTTPCGSLNATLLLYLDLDNLQYAGGWLQAIGVNNIQTLLGDLRFSVTMGPPALVSWTIDIFPNLEVITGRLDFFSFSGWRFVILPGPGLASLRVTGAISFSVQSSLKNTDLAFLSRLECPGRFISGGGLRDLTSLRGLERVVDGLSAEVSCSVFFADSTVTLTNVTALAPLARCGANQRPDAANTTARYLNQPCVFVPCGRLMSWSSLCNYIARATCT